MMRYGIKMTIDSASLGSITIKNLVFPEWWLLWPLPVCFALLAAEFVFRFDRPDARAAGTPQTRRPRSDSAHGLGRGQHHPVRRPVALMSLGLSVAIAFLAINIVGALLFLGGEQGLSQLARNAVASVTSFSLTPIPFFVLMGEVLFHSGVALKAIDAFALLIRRVPGRLVGHRHRRRHRVLGDFRLDHRHHRAARQPDAADHAGPRLRQKFAMGPIIGIGGVDMLIPPSALAVLLGSLAGISISGLLIGGIVPGLILSVLFVGYIILRAHLDPSLAPEEKLEESASGLKRWGPFLVHVLPLV